MNYDSWLWSTHLLLILCLQRRAEILVWPSACQGYVSWELPRIWSERNVGCTPFARSIPTVANSQRHCLSLSSVCVWVTNSWKNCIILLLLWRWVHLWFTTHKRLISFRIESPVRYTFVLELWFIFRVRQNLGFLS